ncbi:MAG: hypothetical protein VCB43_01025, partial [Myxococcota bacterium]
RHPTRERIAMHANPMEIESLQRVFREGFSAADIAESLVSFDDSVATAELATFMEENAYQVVGIRREGRIVGVLERTLLVESQDAPVAQLTQAIDNRDVIHSSASFAEIVLGLDRSPRLFVKAFGEIGGIVTFGDLSKPPLRMWLFGMITIIEMRLSWIIDRFCGGDDWRECISAGRLEKAETLLAERQRRHQDLDLLDCLQFSDKGQIIARSKELRAMMQFESRRQVEDVIKGLERLRNNLAHSQDILSDWKTIVKLAENLDRVLFGPAKLRELND